MPNRDVLRAKCATVMVLVSITGCGGGDARAEASEPSRPAERVQNRDVGAWTDATRWRLRDEVRVGSADSEGPDMFGRVVDVALDPLARVWVADGQNYEIRVFGSDGRHVRSLGRKGGGPSEFGQIAGMDWGPDGNLWVLDSGNARFAVYDTAGRLVTTHRRETGVSMVPWPGGFDSTGRLYDIGVIPGANGEVVYGLIRFSPDLQPADTFRIPPFEGEFFEVVTDGGRNRNRVLVPFSDDQIWRFDPEGFAWTARTARYRLQRHEFSGDTVRAIELDRRPVRVTSEDLDRVREDYKWFTDMGGKLDPSRIPDAKPALNAFFFDEKGFLWVVPVQERGAEPHFDVFDPNGRYLGGVASTAKIEAVPSPVIRGDRMAAVETDESGVPYVRVMRIERPAAR